MVWSKRKKGSGVGVGGCVEIMQHLFKKKKPNQLFQIRIQGLSPDACLGFQGPGVLRKSPVMKKLEDGLQESRPLAVAFFHSESSAWHVGGAQ